MALDRDPELEVAAALRARPTRLSVNLNKVALLRTARGTGVPSVADFGRHALEAGAGGLTAHPRPDGRHIVAEDVLELKTIVSAWPGAELNLEGRPTDDFIDLVARARPHQCSLVPDAPGVLTSDRGWDLTREFDAVAEAVARVKALGCRAILFVDPSPEGLELARDAGADGVEIYTGRYATAFRSGDAAEALAAVEAAAARAAELGLMVNAGHDLTADNLAPLLARRRLDEVSIGHELVADALALGFAQTVRAYLRALRPPSRAGGSSASKICAARLEVAGIRLEPLSREHREELRAAAAAPEIWTHMPFSGHGAGFDRWFDDALDICASGAEAGWAVRTLADGALVGSTRYVAIAAPHRRVEIGHTWYRPEVWASQVNPASKLALLTYAFETLGLNRVELKTDNLNLRSQAAIAKLGARREGVFRAHMVRRDGSRRDSVYFSVVQSDWPAVRARLTARLAAFAGEPVQEEN